MNPEEKPVETPVPQKDTTIKSLRTYQGDVEEAMSKNKTSTTTVFVAEQKKRGFTPTKAENEVDTRKRNKTFIITGMTLLFLGILSVAVVYYIKSINNQVTENVNKSLIGFSEEKLINTTNLTREAFYKQIILEKIAFISQANSVLHLNVIGRNLTPANIKDFLYLIAPQMPASLQRSFENKYMLGIYTFNEKTPFIIFTTNDFATSYSGMLKWEKDMISDLGWLFEVKQNISSTTTFIDEELQNKDLRVLRDNNKKTILLYSFIDKNTLVITGNEEIFKAVLGKFNIGKQTR